MKDIIPAKKQSPILGLTGMGGGVGSNIVAGAAGKVYGDDIFSTYLYKGNNSSNTLNTGLDMSGKGGLTWIKSRNSNRQHILFDTERGANKKIASNETAAQYDGTGVYNQTFTSTGFTVNNTLTDINDINVTYTSWNFRKAKGFFDVVTYTGTGSARTVDHNLGSIPGMILIKRLDSSDNWNVYHRGMHSSNPAGYYMQLNSIDSIGGASNRWNDTDPTATQFTVGTAPVVNANGGSFVAYVFAGGESPAATAKSCPFDGNNDYLKIAASNDLNLDGAFTIEAWVNVDDGSWSGTRRTLLANSTGWATNHAAVSLMNSASSNEENTIILYNNTSTIADSSPVRIEPSDGWTHVAITRDSSNKIRIFKNGIPVGTQPTYSGEFKFGLGETWIGAITMSTGATPETYDGKISNLRVIKGTALYTSAFKPPTEPLTNVTNTKLLCCNNISALASTVTPGTISSGGGLSVGSNDSPFDDPDGFKFGEEEDQNMIKTGSYIGNNNSTGPEVYLGWEPQWVMIKRYTSSESWAIHDSMRGWTTGGPSGSGEDARLQADQEGPEVDQDDRLDLTPTGFKLTSSNAEYNGASSYIYMAIRRPDALVGKPADAGTSVFGLTTGAGNPSRPSFVPNFPVDFNIFRKPEEAGNSWQTSARLMGTRVFYTNNNNAEQGHNDYVWDSNVGVFKDANSDYQGWSWKRHAGFDVVTYKGDGRSGRQIPHSLSRAPEMIWVKNRSSGSNAGDWMVGHKDLYGGSNPWNGYLVLNKDQQQFNDNNPFYNVAPTSTAFTVDSWNRVNGGGETYISFLFASVNGISKVGYFDGSNSDLTITTGFSPRFLIVKAASTSGQWNVLDTTRGWASGNDPYLKLNSDAAQIGSYENGAPTSTGFTLAGNNGGFNVSGQKYIYYAHA